MENSASQAPRGGEARGPGRGTPPAPAHPPFPRRRGARARPPPPPLRAAPLSRQKVSSGEGTRGCNSARRRRQRLKQEPRRQSRGSWGRCRRSRCSRRVRAPPSVPLPEAEGGRWGATRTQRE
ncbi:hypothetical protein MC885_000753 [Smutsia gigantea]|nr:hypothetical protein MC885_000753 [Smutsia gigantea]